jgi:hypothetical protein
VGQQRDFGRFLGLWRLGGAGATLGNADLRAFVLMVTSGDPSRPSLRRHVSSARLTTVDGSLRARSEARNQRPRTAIYARARGKESTTARGDYARGDANSPTVTHAMQIANQCA